MLIYPAIDLFEGQAVRLYKGDYAQKTVYSADPVAVARDFVAQGATRIHLVDLEGARSGATPNFDLVCRIKKESGADVMAEAKRTFELYKQNYTKKFRMTEID